MIQILLILHAFLAILSGGLTVYGIYDGINFIFIIFLIMAFFVNLAGMIYLQTIKYLKEANNG